MGYGSTHWEAGQNLKRGLARQQYVNDTLRLARSGYYQRRPVEADAGPLTYTIPLKPMDRPKPKWEKGQEVRLIVDGREYRQPVRVVLWDDLHRRWKYIFGATYGVIAQPGEVTAYVTEWELCKMQRQVIVPATQFLLCAENPKALATPGIHGVCVMGKTYTREEGIQRGLDLLRRIAQRKKPCETPKVILLPANARDLTSPPVPSFNPTPSPSPCNGEGSEPVALLPATTTPKPAGRVHVAGFGWSSIVGRDDARGMVQYKHEKIQATLWRAI